MCLSIFPINIIITIIIIITNIDACATKVQSRPILTSSTTDPETENLSTSNSGYTNMLNMINFGASTSKSGSKDPVASVPVKPTLTEPKLPPVFKSKKVVPYKHVFWDGKIEYKKRKAPAERLASMINSKHYRSLVLDKAKSTKRKTTSDDWICVYCKRLWSDDSNLAVEKTWVACDRCPLTMHFQCVLRTHTHLN